MELDSKSELGVSLPRFYKVSSGPVLRAVLKLGNMSSSAEPTQMSVRFVCVYASFYRRYQSFQSLFESLFSLVSITVSGIGKASKADGLIAPKFED